MTRDEFIGKLYMVYAGDKNASGDIITEYDRLNKRNKELEDGFKAVNEELCEYAEKIDKAIEYINKNKKEYGSLEDNEKIILDILKGE